MQRRILVVEQDGAVRGQAVDALEAHGFDVLEADVGRQGVYLAERQQPDAVLVGAVLPDIDGPRIVRELRANPTTRDLPVIFLAPHDMPVPQEEGVAGVIVLPLDTAAFPAQVSDLLGWSDEE